MVLKTSVLLRFHLLSALCRVNLGRVPDANFEVVQLNKIQTKSQSECRKKESQVAPWVKLKLQLQFLNPFQRTAPFPCFFGTRQLLVVDLFGSFPEICCRILVYRQFCLLAAHTFVCLWKDGKGSFELPPDFSN